MRTPQQRRADVEALGGDLTPSDLQRIADGAIMDPARIYLPEGKLSEAEYRARQRQIILSADGM